MGVQERKEREKKQRREDVLERARYLFQERGFLNVTMGEIADASEVSIGTLYLYFKNKDDIYAGLACLGSQKIDELVSQTLQVNKRPSHEVMVKFIQKFLQLYADYSCYFDVLKLNFKGRGTVNLSETYASQIRELTASSLSKSVNYFSSRFPKKPGKEEAARATTFAAWAFLLGLSQILDVGRTDIFTEEDIHRLMNRAADILLDTPLEISSK